MCTIFPRVFAFAVSAVMLLPLLLPLLCAMALLPLVPDGVIADGLNVPLGFNSRGVGSQQYMFHSKS